MAHYRQHELITGRNIVITGQQPWDISIGSNCKDIAKEFSKHNRVLYVNSPLDRYTSWNGKNREDVQKRKQVIAGKYPGIELISDNLWVLTPDRLLESINWIGDQNIFEALNKINNRRLAKSIQKALAQLDFSNIILFNDNDIYKSYHLKEMLKSDVSVYYCRDYMLAVDYWKKHGTKLEPELIAKSDVCVANSTYLANYCKQYNPRSYYVGQGCELEDFTAAIGMERPADMLSIKGPIIGYIGVLQTFRLDIDILIYIAKARPHWQIVLVGPEDENFKVSELHSMSNVYFLGPKQVNEVPAYINAFDVCINPQRVSEVTNGNYPRKVDEYLVMGKPVVATVTDAMSSFVAHVYLGSTKEEYVVLIEKALKNDSIELQAERRKFASQHTWANSVKEIYKAINSLTVPAPDINYIDGLPKNLVILGAPRHDDDLESTSFMLAKELTKYFKVYYVDNPFTDRDVIRSKKTIKFKKRKPLFSASSNGLLDVGIPNMKVVITPVARSIHFLSEGILYRWFLKKNEKLICKRIAKVLRHEHIDDYIYFNSFNFHYPDVAKCMEQSPQLSVYHCLDPLVMPFDRKHGLTSEPIIVKDSDMVICSAYTLYEHYKNINPQTYYLPNAADITHSSKALNPDLPVHPLVSLVPHPRIGYFGNIERRMDYPLLEEVIKKLPELNFIFVGPYNQDYVPEPFFKYPNVHFTGKVPYNDMPAVIKGFDVAIIPFKKDEASSSIFPLKLFEYLGAGKPVVATDFNPNLRLRITGDIVDYKNDADSFAMALTHALNNSSDLEKERIALAAKNTWEHRAKELIALMKNVAQNKKN